MDIKCLGISLRDRITNEEIRRRSRETDAIEKITTPTWNLATHVAGYPITGGRNALSNEHRGNKRFLVAHQHRGSDDLNVLPQTGSKAYRTRYIKKFTGDLLPTVNTNGLTMTMSVLIGLCKTVCL